MNAKKRNKKLYKEHTEFIKQPERIKDINEANMEMLAKIDYPLFSFKYLSDASFKSNGDLKFFKDFIYRLNKLSNISWNTIHTSQKHSFGIEKISRACIKPDIPAGITDDVNFIVFRSSGDNKAMVGFRVWNVFHVVFIEARHNDIYDHG